MLSWMLLLGISGAVAAWQPALPASQPSKPIVHAVRQRVPVLQALPDEGMDALIAELRASVCFCLRQ